MESPAAMRPSDQSTNENKTGRGTSSLRAPFWSTFGIAIGIATLFGVVVLAAMAPLTPDTGLLEVGRSRVGIHPEDADLRSVGLVLFVLVAATLFAASAYHTTALAKLEQKWSSRRRE